MQQQVVTYSINMNGLMYNPLKYIDPTGEQYFGWDPGLAYRIEQEMRGIVLSYWHQCYDIALASHHATIAMANCLFSHGNASSGISGSGNQGSPGGGIQVSDIGGGKYKIVGGSIGPDHSITVIDGDNAGTVIGYYLTDYSFFDEHGNLVKDATIDFNDDLGQDFWDFFTSYIPGIDSYIVSMALGGLEGKIYGYNTSPLNFKSMGFTNGEIKSYSYRGMPINFGDDITYITTARDIGNVYAGFLFGYYGWSYESTRNGFDWYNGGPEPPVSKCAQDYGYYLGQHYYYRRKH